jgi:hypothetical protein
LRSGALAAAKHWLVYFIASSAPVKSWRVELPACLVARPTHCPKCGIAAQIPGQPLRLHGHGCRGRQQQGPTQPDGAPEIITVTTRRYRCTGCGCVCSVGPRDIAPRYLYSSSAILLALGLLGLEKLSVSAVRKKICVWRREGHSMGGRWRSIKRWLQDIADGRLLAGLELALSPSQGTRSLSERVAQSVLARAPPNLLKLPAAARVFFTAHAVWCGAAPSGVPP